MKYSTIGYILGQVLKFEGIFMLLPFLTGMIYHENEAYSYLIIGIICFVLGCLITLKKVKHPQIFNREGFVAVALSWIVLSILERGGTHTHKSDVAKLYPLGWRHGGFSIHHVLSPSDGRFDDQPDES